MQNNHGPQSSNDEIDLYEIFQEMFSQKRLILLITVTCLLAAVIYAYLAKPVYEARAYVLPPKQSDIVALNFGRDKKSDMDPFTVKEVYSVYLRNLQSESLKRELFLSMYLPTLTEAEQKQSQEILYTQFTSKLSIAPSSKELPDRYSVSFQGRKASQIAEWVDIYVKKAGEAAKQEIIQNAQREAQVRAGDLERQISIRRDKGLAIREDWIIKLKEALRVAEEINLEKPLIISGNLSAEMSGSMEGQLIYMRGTKALKAEIENLETRKMEDPFIDGLRSLESRLEYFKGMKVTPESISVYRMDGAIYSPDFPIKPNKMLIMLQGLFIGVVLSLFIAFVRVFIAKGRAKALS
ncbi:hypothetical protein A8L59_18570 [Pseudomonas koreensis]|uniref:Polysaccharide chain length determinant N-terminal domain-containing protein n=1 Tax=Pseudomonas koreensis TaxID=198620 RepID=A0AAC9FY73_9PSED|nr:Wzz/FepE/Etk N-terminal domain-containing protein [Pseudomonas koreensis]ANH99327.1 hypothetical protein A8L59_18570 [Pseudomonas koreensis]